MSKSKDAKTRLDEAMTIYKKLSGLGISEDVCPGIKEFRDILNEFVKHGHAASGKIKLPEINRKLVYILSTQPHIVSSASLNYWESGHHSQE